VKAQFIAEAHSAGAHLHAEVILMRRTGFTLVELLVVIAIIGILIALLLPAVQAAREASRRSSCQNNLKQLALGLQNYHDVNKTFPEGHRWRGDLDNDPNDADGGTGFSLWYAILPYIEQQGRYEEFDAKRWVADPVNLPGMRKPLNVFNCPSDQKPPFANDGAVTLSATASYAGCGSSYNGWAGGGVNATPPITRWNGLFERNNRKPFALQDILDGTSNGFAIAEARFRMTATGTNRKRIYGASDDPANSGSGGGTGGASNALMVNGEWQINFMAPANPQPNRTAASEHPGGAQFALVDGSVRFVRDTISHTATPWDVNRPYRQPNGQPYGVYQRLYSQRDGYTLDNF
jgi:prepilin-type N-terminal cleavage/methylation domain-containing protein/prepilin-type processing-associated H-X9-DG protein